MTTPTDAKLPASSSAGGSEALLRDALFERTRREALAERQLTRGSRPARGFAAGVSAMAALLFGGIAALLAYTGMLGASPVVFAGSAVFGLLGGGFGYLSLRWARGLPPWRTEADPALVKQLASQTEPRP